MNLSIEMALKELNNQFFLKRPTWKVRDTHWFALFFFPLNTLEFEMPLWFSIIGSLYKSASTIEYLSKLIIESSSKLAADRSKSGQFARAEYRMWQIFRLADLKYSFSKDTLLQIEAAKRAFGTIYAHFHTVETPSVKPAQTTLQDFEPLQLSGSQYDIYPVY